MTSFPLTTATASAPVVSSTNGSRVLPARRAYSSYRTSRADARARRWLDQGAATRDAALLRKIADEWFCSRPGERALELLGDLAFERGRFAEAIGWWQLLAPPADATPSPGRLAYPDPQDDVPRVRAKQLMAIHFHGHDERGRERLAAYAAKHGSAEGVLGGSQGQVRGLSHRPVRPAGVRRGRRPGLEHLRRRPCRAVACNQRRPVRSIASAFCAAAGRRSGIGLPSFRLSRTRTERRRRPIVQRADYSRSLTFHPLIVGSRLFIADAVRVTAFDLRRAGSPGVNLFDLGFSAPTPQPNQRYTLTVADGCLYARLGQTKVDEKAATGASGADAKAFENRIVCLRLDPAPGEGAVRWVERGLSGANSRKRGRVIFEGTPVVRDGLVYVAATRFETDRRVTAVHCYAAEPGAAPKGDEPPEPVLRWHTDVCEERDPGVAPRYRHHLLTLAGPLVVICHAPGTESVAIGRR